MRVLVGDAEQVMNLKMLIGKMVLLGGYTCVSKSVSAGRLNRIGAVSIN